MKIQCHPLSLHMIYQTNLQISSEIKYKKSNFIWMLLKSKNSFFKAQIHINHTIGNVQNSLVCFPWKNEILSIIKNMNPTPCIMYPCNARFLLKFKNTILDSITTIFNQSLTTETFLEDWKIASVRPLMKGLNLSTELINYRSISKLSILSKIIDKVAHTQLQKHFDNQLLLPKH